MQGREGLFEAQAQTAEMRFATLPPPEPSLLNRGPAVGVPVAAGGGPVARAAPVVLPDEFMRGGGCFAPEGVVGVLEDDGVVLRRLDEVASGDVVATASGHATVRCVVVTPCAGGRAVFSRVRGADGAPLMITEWHPMLDSRGAWRFPIMLGERVYRRCSHVYNLVLDSDHVVLVNGVGCVTLGHGFSSEVAAHPYWGTSKVIDHLRSLPGWGTGRVVMDVSIASHSAAM